MLLKFLPCLTKIYPYNFRSAAYARQVAQKQQKGERENIGKQEQSKPISDEAKVVKDASEPGGLASKNDKHELSSLVKSIKMKSKRYLTMVRVQKKAKGNVPEPTSSSPSG